MTSPRWRFTHSRSLAITPTSNVVTMRVGPHPTFHRDGSLRRIGVRVAAGSCVLALADEHGTVLLDADGDALCVTRRGYVESISYDALKRSDDAEHLDAWKRCGGDLAAYASSAR